MMTRIEPNRGNFALAEPFGLNIVGQMKSPFLIALVALLCGSCTRADTPAPVPALRVIAAPDGSAILRISFVGEEKPRSVATVLKYDTPSQTYRKSTEFTLRNELAPRDAVITNDGRFIVTFDDWIGVGRTSNVVVVYRGTGEFVRAWRLEDVFSEDERKKFISSTSGTWWRGDVALIENERQSPMVFINPETRSVLLDRERKIGRPVIFDVEKMTFKKE